MSQNDSTEHSGQSKKPRRRHRRRGRRSSPNSPNQQQSQQGRKKNRRKSSRPAGKNNSHRNRQHPQRQHRHRNNQMEVRKETSAGGLVVSGLAEAVDVESGKVDLSRIYVALIGRLDRRGRLLWSMPKGHVEAEEDVFHTAEREVWEETGIHGEVIEELGVIDYWFVSDGVRIHKTVHHHLLRFRDGILNDDDPEVTEVAWIPASNLIEHLAYADERKLARKAHDRLPDLAKAEREAGRRTPR